jgi:hypothetical protein
MLICGCAPQPANRIDKAAASGIADAAPAARLVARVLFHLIELRYLGPEPLGVI